VTTNVVNRRVIYTQALASGGSPPTTWNPADKSAGITLSNANLTAAQNTSGANNVRAIASHSTGLYYFEAHMDVRTAQLLVGISNSTASLTAFSGNDNNAIAVNSDGQVWLNGANPTGSPVASFLTGDTVSVSVDMGNHKIWFRTNAGGWNNDILANQNPATNTGGISFSTMAAGPWFPVLSLATLNDAGTANFGATSYAQSVPSGFGNW
jgi:hypothetical protein